MLATTSASVSARPAVITTNANLRSGPSVASPVVGIVLAGAAIDVGRCRGSWCRVSANGGAGYVSSTLIAFGGGGVSVATLPPSGVVGVSSGYPSGGYYNDYAYNDYGWSDYGPGYSYYGSGWGPGIGVGFYSGGYYGGGYYGGRGWDRRHGRGFGDGRGFAGAPGRGFRDGGVTAGAGAPITTINSGPGGRFGGRGEGGFAGVGGGFHGAGGFRGGGVQAAPVNAG
ncbi:hypothetical protein CKO16_17145, partial [Rhodoblastus acidophilus]